ncbi:tRNA (adenosine(37)-N6)-threonylcarbamoyltransferase complex ATPase subunit type 1 TsaE [Deltaproteobacteria bacterium Smac51]|nr:tRNA (adenosine(37)-N6)-threonylcarbamoyltransferase complex ATPase subunit type 1 TsaE [Deltaproteobacteria bacterium Smac51]
MCISSEIYLPSPEETRQVGGRLGKQLAESLVKGALTLPFLITLTGDLGAGKTSLCQGICEALGVDPLEVVSPTFTLANEYRGLIEIYHLDIYRLTPDQFYDAGLGEYLSRPGLSLVEWPEKMPEDFWPDKRLDLVLTFQEEGRLLTAMNKPGSSVINDMPC